MMVWMMIMLGCSLIASVCLASSCGMQKDGWLGGGEQEEEEDGALQSLALLEWLPPIYPSLSTATEQNLIRRILWVASRARAAAAHEHFEWGAFSGDVVVIKFLTLRVQRMRVPFWLLLPVMVVGVVGERRGRWMILTTFIIWRRNRQ